MKVVSVINYKGGVGKTTLTANLAAGMAQRGKKVLMIDLDPQSNLTHLFINIDEFENDKDKKTIKQWFDYIIDGTENKVEFKDIITPVKSGLDLICSDIDLIDINTELFQKVKATSVEKFKKSYIKAHSYLKKEIQKIKSNYDVILIDCPPNFGTVTRNAIIASDYYVIPTKIDYLSTTGILRFINRIENLAEEFKDCGEEIDDPKFLGIIGTMVEIREEELISAIRGKENELKRNGLKIFNTKIRENKTAFAGSRIGLQMVEDYYAYSKLREDFIKLVDEFMGALGI